MRIARPLLSSFLMLAACSDPTATDAATTGPETDSGEPDTAGDPTTTGSPGPSTESGGADSTTGSDESDGSAESSDDPDSPDVPGVDDPGEPVRMVRTVSDGTLERSYIVHLPGDYETRETPAQVVIGFHPAQSSGEGFEGIARLHEYEGADGIVVVYPDGDAGQNGNQAWNAGFCCSSADDLAFFDAILDDLSSLTVIESRVAVTGYSSGAMMVYRLVCDRSEQLSAAVPFAAYLREQDLEVGVCPWSVPVPIMHVHGVLDAQMDPAGMTDAYYPNSGITTLPLFQYMQRVLERNRDELEKPGSAFSRQLDSSVVLLGGGTSYVLIEGLGHAWPGTPAPGPYGPGRPELEGTEAVMDFLLNP